MQGRNHRGLNTTLSWHSGERKEDTQSESPASTSDVIGDRGYPSELQLVNGEMGAGRACKMLSIQDNCGIIRLGGLCLD